MSALATSLRRRLGGYKSSLLFGVLYFTSQAIIGSILHDLDPNLVLQLQTSFSPDFFKETIEAWRQAGLLDQYWSHYWLDFPHPLLYGTFLASLLALGFERNRLPASYNRLLLVPYGPAALDLTENLCHVAMLSNESLIAQPLVGISAAAACGKWLGVTCCLVAVAILTVRSFLRREQRQP